MVAMDLMASGAAATFTTLQQVQRALCRVHTHKSQVCVLYEPQIAFVCLLCEYPLCASVGAFLFLPFFFYR